MLLVVFSLGFFSATLLGLLTVFLVHRRMNQKVVELEERHRVVFQEMIHQLSHRGIVPIGSSVDGLMNIITSALLRVLMSLETHLKAREWNTEGTILELQTIVTQEFSLLHKTVKELVRSFRDTMKDFNQNQE